MAAPRRRVVSTSLFDDVPGGRIERAIRNVLGVAMALRLATGGGRGVRLVRRLPNDERARRVLLPDRERDVAAVGGDGGITSGAAQPLDERAFGKLPPAQLACDLDGVRREVDREATVQFAGRSAVHARERRGEGAIGLRGHSTP